MTASGPFAMGPAMAGNAGSRRSTPRSNFAPSIAPSTSGSSLGAGLSHSAPPTLRKDNDLKGKGKEVKQEDDDEEVYSDDQDEGVEIIDINNVRTMDWMAPESLQKEKKPTKKVKKEKVDPESSMSAHSSA